MAKFKCKATGNIFEFKSDHDIDSMRKHPEYEEIIEQVTKPVKQKKQVEEKNVDL